jgi:hypothetical protein
MSNPWKEIITIGEKYLTKVGGKNKHKCLLTRYPFAARIP